MSDVEDNREIEKEEIIMEEEPKKEVVDEEEEEENDDLFGDDDDEPQTTARKREDGEGSTFGGDDDEDEDRDEDDEYQKELKELEITIPRHAASHEASGDVYSVKVPVFLSVEPTPFDPKQFLEAHDREDLTKEERLDDKLINENTVRWRYSADDANNIIKQSNCHFIEWEDGSLSLKIGKEIFDVSQRPIEDQFLVISHEDHEILQTDAVFTKSVNLIPSSTNSTTHRNLTLAMQRKQKKHQARNKVTDEDPTIKQRMEEERERKEMIIKRREAARRIQLEERDPTPSRSRYSSQEPSYSSYDRGYNKNEYEDDGFIIDDEEEDDDFDEAAERLRKVKSDGAAKYRNPRNDDDDEADDDEEEEEEEEDDDFDETIPKSKSNSKTPDEEDGDYRRKKRRVIEDDEDED